MNHPEAGVSSCTQQFLEVGEQRSLYQCLVPGHGSPRYRDMYTHTHAHMQVPAHFMQDMSYRDGDNIIHYPNFNAPESEKNVFDNEDRTTGIRETVPSK